VCACGNIDSYKIAKELSDRYCDRELPPNIQEAYGEQDGEISGN